MAREVVVKDVEELHQSSGNILGNRVRFLEWQCPADLSCESRSQRTGELTPGCGLTNTQESGSKRVQLGAPEFMKFAVSVNQYSTLLWHFCLGIITNSVVGKVVKHFKREEEARGVHVGVPFKNGLVDNFNVVQMTGSVKRLSQILHLKPSQSRRNLNDAEFGSLIDLIVSIADEVEDVDHHGSVSCAHFVYDEVMVGIERQFIIRHEIAGNCLSIIRPEQLGRRMP